MRTLGTLAMASVLACGLMACSDDDNPTNKCTKEDTTACASAFGTCKTPCLLDESCHHQCQVSFCNCMEQASCDPPAECKDNPLDSGSTTKNDGGAQTRDSSSPDEDAGQAECDGTQAAACNQTQASCLVGCLGNLECQDTCISDYCDCLFEVGCEDNENCG